jgi:hypothetical protein
MMFFKIFFYSIYSHLRVEIKFPYKIFIFQTCQKIFFFFKSLVYCNFLNTIQNFIKNISKCVKLCGEFNAYIFVIFNKIFKEKKIFLCFVKVLLRQIFLNTNQ